MMVRADADATRDRRCWREGLSPEGNMIVVDCGIHGEVGRIPAGASEYERGEALFAEHVTSTAAQEATR